MLSLRELCEWLNITERHARKLVERDAIPYRKVRHLLRFAESEIIIPSIPQMLRLAAALDRFKPGLGDVAVVLAFTGLRWEEAVAVPIGSVSFASQCLRIDRTASESGGRRDVREDKDPGGREDRHDPLISPCPPSAA